MKFYFKWVATECTAAPHCWAAAISIKSRLTHGPRGGGEQQGLHFLFLVGRGIAFLPAAKVTICPVKSGKIAKTCPAAPIFACKKTVFSLMQGGGGS